MDRRQALKALGLAGFGFVAAPASARDDSIRFFGAMQPNAEVMRRMTARPQRRFYDRFGVFRGVSQEVGSVLLWKHLEKEIGKIIPHWQGPDPETGAEGEGDCVAQAGSMGCDILSAVNIHMLGKAERFIAKASVEMNYAGSRVEIGGGELRGGGGSRGEWMARFLKEYGVLHRIKYQKDKNSIDLEGYDPGRSRQYRDSGVPDWLEPIAREHPVQEHTQVGSAREALDAVAAGQPVLLCSSYAVENTRDENGFSRLVYGTTRRRGFRIWNFREQWWHAWILIGKVQYGDREGGTVLNSHGVWNSGPQPDGLPDGAFNLSFTDLDVMIKDWGDCHALSSYKGHEALRVKHKLY